MKSSVSVADVVAALEEAYPPALAEDWDQVGLICGDPDAEVRKVAFALDCTLEVARRAVETGAQMLVVHHPLLLRGVSSVAANTPKGKVIHALLSGGVALFAAHTNADSARPGVSDLLAELVGITPGRPIKPKRARHTDKWGVYIPPADADRVMDALFDAGAGAIGNYERCAFTWEGTGGFTPTEGADPTDGEVASTFPPARSAPSSSPPRGCAQSSSARCAPRTPTRSPPSTSSCWKTTRTSPPRRAWGASASCTSR